LAADEGGGKPRSDAALPADADSDGPDDLNALAGGLGSLAPGEGVDANDDEVPDLAALGAMTARTTLTGAEAEADALEGALVERVERAVASDAVVDALRPAVLTSAPPPARAAWVMPLLVGVGMGIGIAGVMFGLSNHASPAIAAHDWTAVPAAAPPTPLAPTAPPTAAAPAPAPVVAAVEAAAPAPAPRPSAEAMASAPANKPVPASPAHPPAVAARNAHNDSANEAAASAAPASTPAVTVHPAAEAQADGDPDVGAAVSDKPPKPASTMDALLDEALSPKARRDELAARQQAALEADAPPPTPSRADVTQAVAVLLPAIRGCAMGQSGLATAGIVVNSDGRVASVDVAGAPFAGTASGRCMEGVLRRARFPRFTQPSFRIKYPLAIQ
jgi:hypothetical protein